MESPDTPGRFTGSFTYDATGNTTTRDTIDQDPQALTWDAEGRLVTVDAAGDNDATLVYTADGDRLIRREAGVTTVYLPGGQEISYNTATQVTSGTRYYAFNGQTIAVRTGPGHGDVTSLISGPHGTAQVAVDNADNQLTRRYFDPYGETLGNESPWDGDHGFLNKPTDATGLVQVGARYYDPTIGRFISVDPIMDLSDPQQWQGYAYANNNPVTYSDPTGTLHKNAKNYANGKRPRWSTSDDEWWQQPLKAMFAPIIATGQNLVGIVRGISPIGVLDRIRTFNQVNEESGLWAAVNVTLNPMYPAVESGFEAFDAFADGRYGDGMIAANRALQQTAMAAAAVGGALKPFTGKPGSAAPAIKPAAVATAAEAVQLDWSIVSKAGETRAAHVALHEAENASKTSHGVFIGDSQALTNEAWSIAQSEGIAPISANGVDIYRVPMGRDVGYAGGANASEMAGVPHRTIEIITRGGTNELITAYPVPLG